jgi:hypothetical protein
LNPAKGTKGDNMLIFGDAATEAKYLRELREAVQKEMKRSKSKNAKTICKNVLKEHGRFAQKQDVVELVITEELARR